VKLQSLSKSSTQSGCLWLSAQKICTHPCRYKEYHNWQLQTTTYDTSRGIYGKRMHKMPSCKHQEGYLYAIRKEIIIKITNKIFTKSTLSSCKLTYSRRDGWPSYFKNHTSLTANILHAWHVRLQNQNFLKRRKLATFIWNKSTVSKCCYGLNTTTVMLWNY